MGNFFRHVIFVMRIFFHVSFFVGMGNDELKFCVAEPQESR